MRLDEYAAMDGVELGSLIRKRVVSVCELSDLAHEAIEQVNGELNFLAGRTRNYSTQVVSENSPAAPFAGIPFLVKDIGASVAGERQEMGSRLAKGLTQATDSEIVRRFRAAGLNIIGRTTTPELGSTFTTESILTGPTRNPWDLQRSVGGSSGGAAAAVAAGVVPIAHGGDSAGSIRIPAHCCGVFGFKPSRGRNPVGPQSGEVNSGLTVAHVLTRSVRDSAAVLDITAGPDLGCRYTAPRPMESFLSAVHREPPPLRIAVTTQNPFGGDVSREVSAATEAAAVLCEQMGHSVEVAAPPLNADEFCYNLGVVWSANVYHTVEKLRVSTETKSITDLLEASTRAIVERGARVTADSLLSALDGMNRYSRDCSRFFSNYDVLLSPPMASTALRLGVLNADEEVLDVDKYFFDLLSLAPFTAQANVTGQPAMCFPMAISPEGLPVGVHAVGRYAEEETLFSLAGKIEMAAPWKSKLPLVRVKSALSVQ